MRARDLQKNIAVFSNADEFLNAKVKTSTPIYIDLHLKGGLSGFDIAEHLREQGYSRLNIASGQEVDSVPDYIVSISGKEFPDIGNLQFRRPQ
jgi:hypothetical protein